MILKGVRVSLWTRNLQLAAYSVVTAFIPLYVSGDLATVMEKGFFYGYTNMTWACILMNAGGGLLVGTVIKYADAVTKDVAIGASIGMLIFLATKLSQTCSISLSQSSLRWPQPNFLASKYRKCLSWVFCWSSTLFSCMVSEPLAVGFSPVISNGLFRGAHTAVLERTM